VVVPIVIALMRFNLTASPNRGQLKRAWPICPSVVLFTAQAGTEFLRFTEMPAFGDLESPDHVCDLVNYVRTLSCDSQKGDSTK